ncbi:fasciclin domain-containing protein, partial [Deinococcus planocerae]|uniref:fasciclin domain-containing protein n=1 Tax=Deinococcus planocerae TaxID=1737569 RepID=UPI0011AF0B0D
STATTGTAATGTTGTAATGAATGSTEAGPAAASPTGAGTTATGTATTGATGATGTGTATTGTTATGTTTGTATTGTTGTAATGATTPPAATPSNTPGTGPNSSVATTSRNNTSLAALIASDDRFTTLARLVQAAGLTETLSSGDFTIFAPTNDAFLKLAPSDLNALAADPARLREVLLYHVVPTRVTGTALASANQLTTAQSGVLTISREGAATGEQRTRIGNATTSGFTQPGNNITTGNGVLYVLDTVLLPPAAGAASTTTGTTGTAATGTATGTTATGTTGTATTGTTGTGTTGTAATGTATGTTTTAATTATPPAVTPSNTPGTGPNSSVATTSRNNTSLAALIASDDRFTTLARLVQAAGLTETLSGGDFTIFAPTNDAFLKLAPSDLNALAADPARLRQVLLYHVVPGRVTGTALASANQLTTAQSGVLTLSREGAATGEQRTRIGNAATSGFTQPGNTITTGNGILYVLDTVLLPPAR